MNLNEVIEMQEVNTEQQQKADGKGFSPFFTALPL